MKWSSSSAIFLFLSLLIASCCGDFNTSAIQAVRCMIFHKHVSKCSDIPETPIASYLVDAYKESPSTLHDALPTRQLSKLSTTQIASIPISLLYLIPKARLSELSAAQLAAILQTHWYDKNLAYQLLAGAKQRNWTEQLLSKMKPSALTQDVQQAIGETITAAELNSTVNTLPLNLPLLAYLHPKVMLNLNSSVGFNVFFRLQGIKSPSSPRKEAVYILVQMALNVHYPLNNINWLVLGMTPDDIRNNSIHTILTSDHLKLDLSIQQARAVFDIIYQNMKLRKSDVIDCLPVLSKLNPTQLATLPLNYDVLLKVIALTLPTACQVKEYIKADCQLTGKLPKMEDEMWGHRIRYLQKWVYTLPLTALREYLTAPLRTADLLEIESPSLSALQSYYLTGRGLSLDLNTPSSVMVPDVILRALPASKLLSLDSVGSSVLEHLASNLPADNLPRTLAWVYRTTTTISDWSLWEDLLNNNDANLILSLISPKTLNAAAPRLLRWLKDNKTKFEPIIRQFPQEVLTALLQSEKRTWHQFLDKTSIAQLLIGGLTCKHIEEMSTGLFIPIMAEYNRHRQQAFPRNLQICCLRKLVDFLKFKMNISQTDPHNGLISVLEPIEIHAIGGYILAGLPINAVEASPYVGHILATIGKLSNGELMLAANFTHLCSLASLLLDKDNNADEITAGNLVWYLPPKGVTPTKGDFKLILESGRLDKTLCLPKSHRRSIASNLIANFGSPHEWNSGVMATLQDLLVVFSEEELHNVTKQAWTDAGDILNSHYGDYLNWISPTPFYQMCMSVLEDSEKVDYKLSIRRLVRWRLQAAQWLLATIKSQRHTATTVEIHPIELEEVDMTRVPVFNPYLNLYTTTNVYTPESLSASTTQSVSASTTENVSAFTTENVSAFTTETVSAFTTESVSVSTTESGLSQSIFTVNDKIIDSSFQSITQDRMSTTATLKHISDKYTTFVPKIYSTSSIVPTIEETDLKDTKMHSYPIQSFTNTRGPENNLFNETYNRTTEQNKQLDDDMITVTKTVLSLHSMPSSNYSSLKYYLITGEESNKPDTTLEIKNLDFNKDLNVKLQTLIESKHMTNLPPLQSEEVLNTNISSPIMADNLKNTSILSNVSSETPEEEIEEDDDDDNNNQRSIIENTIISDNTNSNKRRRNVDNLETAIQISCNAIRIVGSLSGIAITEQDVILLPHSEIEECRVEFGLMDLSPVIREYIWNHISDDIKKEGLHWLGGLLEEATVADIWVLEKSTLGLWNASQPWILETVDAFVKHNNDTTLLKRVFEGIQESNPEFPAELSAVIGGSLCYYEWEFVNSLNISMIGFQSSSTQCPCYLPLLAEKAIQELGPISNWTQHHLHYLKVIVAGLKLEDWRAIVKSDLKLLSGLQPDAVRCLNKTHLEILTPNDIKLIPTLTLHALMSSQIKNLSENQTEALWIATQVSIDDQLVPTNQLSAGDEPSSGSYCFGSTTLMFIILLYACN